MLSHRKGDLSAAAQAEGLSPEITIVVRGQALHTAETGNGLRDNKGECSYGGDAEAVLARMEALLDEEDANARETIPAVETDSRLGWEPSMEYVCDRWYLE